MAGRIAIDVVTLNGIAHHYDIDISQKISELIKHIINTHEAFTKTTKFDPQLVELNKTKLIYNGKTLDHSKSLEEYTDFQYKPKGGNYKIHIVAKGGDVSNSPIDESELLSNSQTNIKRSTSPISINSISVSVGSRLPTDHSFSRSFPGTSTSFLDNQINRLDRRQRTDSLRQVSESLNDISQFLRESSDTTESSERLDKVMQILGSIDSKLGKLIEMGTPH